MVLVVTRVCTVVAMLMSVQGNLEECQSAGCDEVSQLLQVGSSTKSVVAEHVQEPMSEKLEKQLSDSPHSNALAPMPEVKRLPSNSRNHLQHSAEAFTSIFGRKTRAASTFDCAATPSMCKEPFNCQSATTSMWDESSLKAADPTSWCEAPQYANYATACLADKDLVKAARIQFDATVKGDFGPCTAELDGSYCFIEGHCTNKAVTNSTTLKEADDQCDKRYGQEWRKPDSILSAFLEGTSSSLGDASGCSGFTSKSNTKPFLMAACAMGNYHCDVMYCKETYCKDKHYKDRYSHFLEENGYEHDHDGDY